MLAAAPEVPTLTEIRSAASALAPYIVRTPLLRFNAVDGPNEIFLKLENLQPIGAFKVRPMGNAVLTAVEDAMHNGVYTASSGNAGLGLAWIAQQLGLTATIYAPQSAPAAKLDAVRNFGATVQSLGDDEWWQIIEKGGHPSDPGLYVDAVRNPAALAGNATIGLDIVADLPDVDTLIVPFGGGGVACRIASAIRAVKPDTRIIVAESDAATPVTQFIGEIPQSRAAQHRHLYEETITILSGEGVMWTDETKTPVQPGDTIFLPLKQAHSLECTSPDGMRLLGLFYPSMSPAINY